MSDTDRQRRAAAFIESVTMESPLEQIPSAGHPSEDPMSDSRDPKMNEAMEDVRDLQYAAAASFFATEDAAARPGGEGTPTDDPRDVYRCEDCGLTVPAPTQREADDRHAYAKTNCPGNGRMVRLPRWYDEPAPAAVSAPAGEATPDEGQDDQGLGMSCPECEAPMESLSADEDYCGACETRVLRGSALRAQSPAPAGEATCGKCGNPKGHPLHDPDCWPGRITTSHPHHGFVPREQMTVDDLTGHRPAPASGAPDEDIEIGGHRYTRNVRFTAKYPGQQWLRVDPDGSYHYAGADAWLDEIERLRSEKRGLASALAAHDAENARVVADRESRLAASELLSKLVSTEAKRACDEVIAVRAENASLADENRRLSDALAAAERAGVAWAKQATENAMDALRMNWLEAAGGKYDLTCWNVDWPSKNNGWAIGGDDEIDDVAKGATAREALDAAIAAHPEVPAALTPTAPSPDRED